MKMLKITENTKVYAYCPAGVETGGVELLHQVIDIINNNGGNGYVYYFGDKPHRVPNAYKKYNIEVCEEIEDNEQNIIILPETKPFIVFEYSNIRVLVWWMSVDFFYKLNRGNLIIGDIFKFNKWEAIKELLKRFISLKPWSKKRYSLKNLRENKRIIYNCYQSMYASDFLARNGFSNCVRLSDYINDDYLYTVRVGVVMLMDFYLTDEYLNRVFSIIDSIKREEYYINMAIAWCISIAFIKHRKRTLLYLKNCQLDKFTYNKAIQKIRESSRVSDTDKQMLQDMKIK